MFWVPFTFRAGEGTLPLVCLAEQIEQIPSNVPPCSSVSPICIFYAQKFL